MVGSRHFDRRPCASEVSRARGKEPDRLGRAAERGRTKVARSLLIPTRMKIQIPANAHIDKPAVSGADVAPTEKAAQRERERHELERQLGRAPGGHDGELRDHRSKDVTRKQLDEAAKEADRRVAGRELPKKA